MCREKCLLRVLGHRSRRPTRARLAMPMLNYVQVLATVLLLLALSGECHGCDVHRSGAVCRAIFCAYARALCARGYLQQFLCDPQAFSLESDCAQKWIPPRRRGSPPGVASLRERDSLRDDVSAVPYIRIARALTHSVLRVRRTQCLAVPKAPTAARTRGRQLRAAPSAAPARATKRWSLKW